MIPFRRVLLIILVLLCCLSVSHSHASHQPSSPLKGEIQSASEFDYPPFALVLDNGEADGFSVDLLKAVCAEIGLKVKIKVGPWHQLKEELKNGAIDVLPLVSYSKERDVVYDFTVPYLRMHGTIFVRQGNESIRNEQDLAGKEVLVMRGDTAQEYALENGLTDNLILTETFEEALRLLSEGKHDAVLVQQLVGWQIIKRLQLDNIVDVKDTVQMDLEFRKGPLLEFEQKFCFAVHEGDSNLLSALNEGLAIVVADGTYAELYHKWFGAILPQAEIPIEEIIKTSLYIAVPFLLFLSLLGLFLLNKRVREKTEHLVEEIEKRKIIEADLSLSNRRNQTIVNNCGEGLVVVQDGLLIFVNPKYCEMVGREESVLLGTAFNELVDPAYRDLVSANYARRMAGESVAEYQLQFSSTGGSIGWFEISGAIIEWEGGPASLLFIQDVTEKKKSVEAILESKREAEHANKAKSMFLANMSHELRTPINGVMGMHQLLQTTSLDEEQSEYVSIAIQSSDRLTRLLSDILDLSRVEAEVLVMNSNHFKLDKLVREVGELFKPFSKQSGISLTVAIDSALQQPVIGDEFRIQQVLNNLIGNAFKFTSQGSIAVDVSLMPSSDPDTSRVKLIVSDTGRGIPADKMNDLFTPFTQVEGDYSRSFQGAGLGLAIVKNLVDLMGGSITLESTEGVGTTVCLEFTFPKGIEQTEEIEPSQTNTCVTTPGCEVLVVEDDDVSSLTLSKQVEKMGYSVEAVSDGKECLAILNESHFDLILMDVQMPVMDGLEATRAIRKREQDSNNEKIPIVAVTAYAMAGDREKFIEAGMDDYLSKPVALDALVNVLGKFLGEKINVSEISEEEGRSHD
ncbi:MAG: transporter substrate-binding domain-containing protein [Pseudodesulfovibrio sp.]